MTDIYVAYAREDRERVIPLADMLREQGWDVWLDTSAPSLDANPSADLQLTRAGAILAFWSEHARRSEHVRSEAATGLYKNKLVQVRLEGGAPPRPFDQVDAVDMTRGSGPESPEWRRLVSMLRNTAGEPVAARQSAQRRAAPPHQPAPPVQEPPRSYSEPQRSFSEPPRSFAPPPRPAPAPPPQPPAPPESSFVMRPLGPGDRLPPPPPPMREEYDDLSIPTRFSERLDRPERVYTPPPEPPPYRRPPEGAPDRLPHADLGLGPSYAPGGGGNWAGPVMVVAALALIGTGAGLWFADPFGWRGGAGGGADEPVALAARNVPDAMIANGEPATGAFTDSEESDGDWERVNRSSPEALRDHIEAYPRASTAEAARAALRVLDAQAWVKAVTSDNEPAYRAYLAAFPADGGVPGAMAGAARDRLSALDAERSQAIEEIQRGLAGLGLFQASANGEADAATQNAVKQFAASSRKAAPALATAPPRDLRAFAQSLHGSGTQTRATAAVTAAQEADKQRIAQAQAASAAATIAANESASRVAKDETDALTRGQQVTAAADREAWAIAERAGTAAGYQAYLSAWPDGAQAAKARGEIARMTKPAPYAIEQLSDDVKGAVEAARRAQSTANQRATAARASAAAAETVADARSIVGAGGDRYDAQIADGAPNGLGVRVRGAGVNAGDRYRGELRNGQSSGLGVYEFAENQGNASARAARYEGEHSGDAASGHGVMVWRSGDSFAGSGAGGTGQSRGVLTYANGLRYEGEMLGGQRHGFGVVWAADGSLAQAGRWVRDELSEPMGRANPG